jgi:hypothetical protein
LPGRTADLVRVAGGRPPRLDSRLSSLRPLERDDFEQVADLFLRVVRPGSGESVADTAAYFQRTTLDHPWADPDIPSLVFVDDRGSITGFIGSYVTRMRFDGAPIRAACPGNLVAAPGGRGFPPGALLLREHLGGPQDFTFVDTLGDTSRSMWKALRGDAAFIGALSWVRIFRPAALANERLVEPRAPRLADRVGPSLASALDAALGRVGSKLLGSEPPATSAKTLDAAVVIAELPRLTASVRLHPEYDRPYLDWLFEELATPRLRGRLVRRVVHRGDRVLGWYVYFLKPGGISRVLQVIGSEADVGSVIDHLFHDARASGAAALEGRVEARLLEALASRGCILRYAGASGVHSRNDGIREAIFSSRSIFTRMESEYWPIPPRPQPS